MSWKLRANLWNLHGAVSKILGSNQVWEIGQKTYFCRAFQKILTVSQSLKTLFLLFNVLIFNLMAVANTAETDTSAAPVSESQAQEEKFNPTPIILHHIADANEFEVIPHLLSIPLPCLPLYQGSLSFFMSNDHEAMEAAGYHMHHGRIARIDGAAFTDFSITKNVFSMLLGALILVLVFTSVASAYKNGPSTAPKGLQSWIEPMVVFVRDDVAKPGIGHHYEKYLPYLLTIFFFILINNLLGLIPFFPGSANVTGNIAVTMVLAVIALLMINLNANKYYWKHIFMPPVPVFLWPILIPVELLGVFTKPISLMIRLFANITAGHIIVLSLVSLIFVFGNAGQSIGGSTVGAFIAVPFTLFISVIELMVAFIQAFIFTTLTATFIGMAIEEHHDH